MYGSIYSVSWWGETNEPNGWGSIYPANAEGSLFTADSNTFFTDSSSITVDNGTE
jgi:hypothetical protein